MMGHLLLLVLLAFVPASLGEEQNLFEILADATHSGFVAFFNVAAYPDLSDCVSGAHSAVMNAAKGISLIVQEDEKDYYLAGVKIAMALVNLAEELRTCKNILEPFRDIVQSMGRFGVLEFLVHAWTNVTWNAFDLARCVVLGIKAWNLKQYSNVGKHVGRFVFVLFFDH